MPGIGFSVELWLNRFISASASWEGWDFIMNEAEKPDKSPEAAPRVQANLLEQVDLDVLPRLNGMVLGSLTRIDGTGRPWVVFPGASGEVAAATTVPLNAEAVGARVTLMFASGDPNQPVVMGVLREAAGSGTREMEVRMEGERLVLEGHREIELRCGKASILLRENGKVVVKGTHIVSRSSGANKVKGASIALN
jgi:hypothetical protein